MSGLVTGGDNVAVGMGTMFSLTGGTKNIGIGREAARFGTTASSNVAIGNFALATNIIGNDNVALGDDALTNATGSGNTAIGSLVGAILTTGSRNILIGQGVDVDIATRSDHLNIGNVLIGDLATGSVAFNDGTRNRVDSNITSSFIMSPNGLETLLVDDTGAFYNGVEVATVDDIVVGSGDVTGPASSIDFSIPTFNGVTGKLLRESPVSISSTAVISATGTNQSLTLKGNGVGTVIHDGFTRLGGAGNIGIKIKKITGTSASNEGGTVTIAHGLALSKISGIQALVEQSVGNKITHGFTAVAGHEFSVFADATNIRIGNHPTNSENILSKLVTVLITYV